MSRIFKFQAIIPNLWLIRERRCDVGLQTWFAWPNGVGSSRRASGTFATIQGLSFPNRLGPTVALGITVFTVGFALLRRGGNALARFGIASVVASPTPYRWRSCHRDRVTN